MPAVASRRANKGAGKAKSTKSMTRAARRAGGSDTMAENSRTMIAASASNSHCATACDIITAATKGMNSTAPAKRRMVPDMVPLSVRDSG